jgi:hypothetical protein
MLRGLHGNIREKRGGWSNLHSLPHTSYYISLEKYNNDQNTLQALIHTSNRLHNQFMGSHGMYMESPFWVGELLRKEFCMMSRTREPPPPPTFFSPSLRRCILQHVQFLWVLCTTRHTISLPLYQQKNMQQVL